MIECDYNLFFDRGAISRAIDATTEKVLSRAGAFVRTRARSSIRKRKKISKPGSPPTSQTGLLKQFIFFQFDPESKSVVIGPARLNAKAGVAPSLLEHGGSTKTWKGKPATYQPRPYMKPAFDAEAPKFAGLWNNAIKR